MPLDFNRPIETRSGRKVVIYTTEAGGVGPVHGKIEGEDMPAAWTLHGSYCFKGPSSEDSLINVPEKRKIKFWVNVYKCGGFLTHSSKEAANSYEIEGRIACLEIEREFVEGEGL